MHHTSMEVPILTVTYPREDIDLYEHFLSHGVLTVHGSHFINLGRNSVRLRVPRDPQDLKLRLRGPL